MTSKEDEKESHHPVRPISSNGTNEIGETEVKPSVLASSRQWIRRLGAEEAGIERIDEEDRTDQRPWSQFTVFYSANSCSVTMLTGTLGPATYGLGWWDSALCIIFFNALGAILPSLVTPFGHKLGLRTMLIPRYCFGWWFAKVLAVLNILNQLGWGIVGSISGAVLLNDVADGKLPLAVGILIITLIAMLISLMGYKVVHVYEKYSWIVTVVAFFFVAGFGAKHFVNVPMGSGSAELSSVLSFGTTIMGFEAAWTPVAADYGVYMKKSTRARTAFAWAYSGFLSSQVLTELLGAAIGTLLFSNDTRFADAYDRAELGGLIGAIFENQGTAVRGFGKFIELILALSVVAVTIFNCYSMGLSVQMISKKSLLVPRLIWTLLGAGILTACAIAGRDHLESVMTNFLNMCAYWLVPFSVILALEHLVFRKSYSQYDVDAWNDPRKLPYGIAAIVSFVLSTLIALLSMSQTWWVGPIAKAVSDLPSGTDISWMLALGCVILLFVPLRYWERKKWGY